MKTCSQLKGRNSMPPPKKVQSRKEIKREVMLPIVPITEAAFPL